MTSSQLDPVRDGRSPAEVLFKTLAIYAATTGAVGHLTTLRKTSDSEEAVAEMEVLGFLVFPTMPLASTVYHTRRTARLGLRHWQVKFARSGNGFVGNAMLYVSACLGARAIFSVHGTEQPEGADSTLLYRVAYSDRITSRTCEFNLRWFGRLLLIALFAQAVATLILGMRRCLHGQALAATDLRNMFLAFGGGWAEMLTISLTVINHDWYVERDARHAVTANREQLSEIWFDGLYAVQSSNHFTTHQLNPVVGAGPPAYCVCQKDGHMGRSVVAGPMGYLPLGFLGIAYSCEVTPQRVRLTVLLADSDEPNFGFHTVHLFRTSFSEAGSL